MRDLPYYLILHLPLFSLLSPSFRHVLLLNLHKTQFLIQECVSLISKPNFISTLCYAIDNPLHYQKVRSFWQTFGIIAVVVWMHNSLCWWKDICIARKYSHLLQLVKSKVYVNHFYTTLQKRHCLLVDRSDCNWQKTSFQTCKSIQMFLRWIEKWHLVLIEVFNCLSEFEAIGPLIHSTE